MLLYCPSFRGKAAEFPLTSEKRSPLTIAVLRRPSLHALWRCAAQQMRRLENELATSWNCACDSRWRRCYAGWRRRRTEPRPGCVGSTAPASDGRSRPFIGRPHRGRGLAWLPLLSHPATVRPQAARPGPAHNSSVSTTWPAGEIAASRHRRRAVMMPVGRP